MTGTGPGPLTASDAALYVPRRVDQVVRRAINTRENVLLGVLRGAGATSLLYRLENGLPDAIYVGAEQALTANEVLASVASRLRVARSLVPDLSALTTHADPLAAPPVLEQVRHALAKADRHPVVLVDGPIAPEVAFELFGRWRDELFALPATWVVVAHEDRLAQYLTPPADVFFDVVIKLDPLCCDEALQLLERRDALAGLSDEVRSGVLEAFDGTPRHLLRLVRRQLGPEPRKALEQMQAHAEAAAALGRGAHMLLAEMQGRGPVAATDPDLRNRLGLSDRQMRRNLLELRDAGLVEIVRGGSGAPGRPPSTFRLTELGHMSPATR
jgi:DNA-binding transcriptional ArsR family regulator